MKLQREAKAASAHPAAIIKLQDKHLALDLWRALCSPGAGRPEDALLLLPPHYELLQQEHNLKLISELLFVGRNRSSPAAALTFGAFMPNEKVCNLSSSDAPCLASGSTVQYLVKAVPPSLE